MTPSGIVCIILSIVFIVIGIINAKGNISMLHSYHRNRVKKEDILPFGKKVGAGMIIIGISMMVFGGLSVAADIFSNEILNLVGVAIMGVGLIVGLVITFKAMIKYNGGIF